MTKTLSKEQLEELKQAGFVVLSRKIVEECLIKDESTKHYVHSISATYHNGLICKILCAIDDMIKAGEVKQLQTPKNGGE